MILPAYSRVLYYLCGGGALQHHTILDHFDSREKQCTHPLAQVTVQSRNIFCFSWNLHRCLADTLTCCAFWSIINVFGSQQAFTFFNSKCSWIIVSTLPLLMLLLDAVSHTVICLFSKLAFHHVKCSHHLQLLAECEHTVGSRLPHGLQKTYYASCRYMHMTGSLLHRVHLTYGDFLLVSPSLAPGIWWYRTLGVTRSDAILY
jgi:hypothetical protein